MDNKLTKRINFTLVVFAMAFIAIIVKAFMVQVVDRKKLISRANKQFFKERTVYPRRGHIYDRNGHPLAINVRTYSIFAIPKKFKNRDSISELRKIIPTLKSDLSKKIAKRNRFTWIARKIKLTEQQYKAAKEIPGIYAEEIPKRFYPNHELAAQTLGFVGVDNKGLSGIEYLFDKELRGEPKVIKYITDRKGRPVRYVSHDLNDGSRSKDLYLSYDKEVQAVAEKAIKEAVEESEAFRGGVGVMNAETGEIIAMANYPSFDPNDLSSSESIHRKLSFVTDPFEPGSTMKTLTVASALENKIVRSDTNYFCEHGRLKVEDHIISEAESKKKYEWLSVADILKYSSNVGTTKIAFDLTFPRLRSTLEDFGIGEKVGIEIPGESRGIFTDAENVSPLSLSNISFGQGVATTGIQLLAAYSAFINGGYYVKPTVIKVDDKSKIEKTKIISEDTAKEITKMLVDTVEHGTGSKAKIPHFTIAGKTSTAQRSDNKGGYKGYVPGFIGYPVGTKNKFIVYAYVDNPMPGKPYYGNLVAGPVFRKVTEFILYKSKEFQRMAESKPYENEAAFVNVKNKRRKIARVVGRGKVPNFLGLDKKSAGRLADKLGIELIHKGIGVVSSQIPEAGVELNKEIMVKLDYTPPVYE